MGSRGWVEVLGTLAASCEARRAKPAIFNGRPGSAVESMGAVRTSLDSRLPCNTASGPCYVVAPSSLWTGAKGPAKILRQPLICQACRFLFPFLTVLKKLAFLLVGSLRFWGGHEKLQKLFKMRHWWEDRSKGQHLMETEVIVTAWGPPDLNLLIVNCLFKDEILMTGQDS